MNTNRDVNIGLSHQASAHTVVVAKEVATLAAADNKASATAVLIGPMASADIYAPKGVPEVRAELYQLM